MVQRFWGHVAIIGTVKEVGREGQWLNDGAEGRPVLTSSGWFGGAGKMDMIHGHPHIGYPF